MPAKKEYVIDKCHKQKELVMWDLIEHLPYRAYVPALDFTTIGLRKESATYNLLGRKQHTDYTLNGKLAVRKAFDYTDDGVWVLIKWYHTNRSIAYEKQFFKPLTTVEVEGVRKGQRDRAIMYLQANAKGTPAEPYINIILKHYQADIAMFVQSGSDDLVQAIETESDPVYQGILAIDLGGQTVKEVIYSHIQP